MKAVTKTLINEKASKPMPANESYAINTTITQSWSKIAPFWPLKNLIAVNPLAGFEDLPFEEGLRHAKAYFQQPDIPQGMQQVNRESIKWLQAFFDNGQATIPMPNRHGGLLTSTRALIRLDKRLYKNEPQKKKWLDGLPDKAEMLIAEALLYLGIPAHEEEQFLTLLLTTLAGWAAHVQYRVNWADTQDAAHPHAVTHSEYLAFRLLLTCLVWPEAKALLTWHQQALKNADTKAVYNAITANEASYQSNIIKRLRASHPLPQSTRSQAQLIFCIDVRSEPFRRALEAQGKYETLGFAGFFGVPVSIENAVTGDAHASCPVLLKPAHTVVEYPNRASQTCRRGHKRLQGIKKLYQSLKYTFITPFSLVETMGLANGLWMALKTFSPRGSTIIQATFKRRIASDYSLSPNIKAIPFSQQVAYGEGALRTMGLTENFAPLIVFCGHGSTTQNNAYASALDCGACGGRHGAPNARILALILNSEKVRDVLAKKGLIIPQETRFLAAEHNTTTDEVELYHDLHSHADTLQIASLQRDLESARDKNRLWRSREMGINLHPKRAQQATADRAQDWAQVRPEWGLARNAAFIVGPRGLTKNIDFEGRAFLHSYAWEKDIDRSSLTTILTAPMIVAQWINAQYCFSTLDNVAFGGGSKVTKNITGKIGIMQGNASDLMHGLPLQSVFASDNKAYHTPMRLTVIVYAPRSHIDPIIAQHGILQKLFGNGWVNLMCHDPISQLTFNLQRDLTWA